jgi:chemotaxis protein MotB
MRILLVVTALLTFSSCLVSKKKFDAQTALANKYQNELKDCQKGKETVEASLADMTSKHDGLRGIYEKLVSENEDLELKHEKLLKEFEEEQAQYENLKDRLDELGKSSVSEKEKLRLALMEKEKALDEREKRIKDLENLISKKDDAVRALKKKISDALVGFNSSELTVTQKDGKVYVSLSDKLLFKTGSFDVDQKGKQAIVKLSEVLNRQTEIGIVVEGHTDNKQYINPKGEIKNNWDLSVMRATAVAGIMINDGKVEAKRVTPSGHAEFFPIESNETPEGRAKNRRIEIVLSPDLKEIFDILDSAGK